VHRSRGAVARLAALFAIDAFAGGLKIIYDIAIFALFRHVRPPEEIGEPPRKSRPSSS